MKLDIIHSTAISLLLAMLLTGTAQGQSCDPEFNLPALLPDKATICCNSGTAKLIPSGSYVSYIWSTGETTQTIEVTDTGVYYLSAIPIGQLNPVCDSVMVVKCDTIVIDTICEADLPLTKQDLGLSSSDFLRINGVNITGLIIKGQFPTDQALVIEYSWQCGSNCPPCTIADSVVFLRNGGLVLLETDDINPENLVFCSEDSKKRLLETNIAGGTFSSNMLDIFAQSGKWYLRASTSSLGNGVLEYKVNVNGCELKIAWSITIGGPEQASIHDLPPIPICTNKEPFMFYGVPSGGSFTLDNVPIGTTINPGLFVNDTVLLRYNVSDTYGCVIVASEELIFRQPPLVAMVDLDDTYCNNWPSVPLAGSPGGGTFTLDSMFVLPNDELEVSALDIGQHKLIYTYQDEYCEGEATPEVFTVLDAPYVAILNSDSTICFSDGSVKIEVNRNDGYFDPAEFSTGWIDPELIGIGSYLVQYTVMDLNKCRNSDQKLFNVVPNPTISLDSVYECIPYTFTIFNFSSSIVDFTSHWMIGADVFQSKDRVFDYQFPSAGTFGANLLVVDNNGCESDTFYQYTVPEINESNIKLRDSIVLTKHEAVFNIESLTDIINSLWFFGDGNISSDSAAIHEYALAGVYDIILSTFDIHGCADTSFARILVKDPLEIDFDIVNLYPNPTEGTVTIDYYLPEASILSILLFDESGRFIREFPVDEGETQQAGNGIAQIDLSEFTSGVYFIGIYNNSDLTTGFTPFKHGALISEKLKVVDFLKIIKVK